MTSKMIEDTVNPADTDADPAPEVRRAGIAVTLTICLACLVGFFAWPEPSLSQSAPTAQQERPEGSAPEMSAQLSPATATVKYQ